MAVKRKHAKAPKSADATAGRTTHHRVTSAQKHRVHTLPGMHPSSRVTQAGTTAHFEVFYLTSLKQKGAALAAAILQNCERDYSTLQQAFGGITPQRLP